MTQTQTTERAKRQRTLVGKVVSNKMDKTIVVLVERRVKHPVLGKIIMRSAKYKAHDEENKYANNNCACPLCFSRPANLWLVAPSGSSGRACHSALVALSGSSGRACHSAA